MRRWWEATEGIRFLAWVFLALVAWVIFLVVVR
jgi:hypothetical protein